ncbi:MAG: VIT1/CCC1 family protein [Nitrososphaerales archaeon]|nr:VIT1/CCC1 family protein [Nitrososphaerales archaeon]
MADPKEPLLTTVAKVGISDEFADFTLYDRLAKRVANNSSFAEVLRELSATEKRHYEFWKKYIPEEKPKFSRAKLYLVLLFQTIFGLTFAVRYLERHESTVIKQYKSVADIIPAEDKEAFREIIREEEQHEKEFRGRVESSSIRYISFVVLGLADALVEITGIHAGSLGIYNSTVIAGLAGVIAGGAASLAMASAAFAQAKQGFQGSARLSAVYTGISYFVTAVILAAPYFLTRVMLNALSASLFFAVVILALATYYSSVISYKPFTRDFVEILLIMFGVTAALYFFGYFIRDLTGITI